MSTTIGKKIKELRKALKMTQEELAQPEMTKGMLSHIENGTANPSMKNLHYLANKLNKPTSYFFQENMLENKNSSERTDLPIDEILNELNAIDALIKKQNYKLAKVHTKKLFLSYTFDESSKLYADLLYRIGNCCIQLGEFGEGEAHIKTCCEVYLKNMLYTEASKAYMALLKEPIEKYEYNKCLSIIAKAQELYNKSTSRDIFLELLILINQPSIAFAKGDFDMAIDACEKSISLSDENNVYYFIDYAYRIMAITYLIKGDYEKFIINADKAKKYGEFTDNKLSLAKIYHNYAKYENTLNNPLKALNYLELLENNAGEKSFFYYLEHGKANYLLGNFQEALEDLSKITYSEKIPHMIDCIYILTGKVYKGLVYSKLENFDNAVNEIEYAIKELEKYTKIEYMGIVKHASNELSFAFESLSEAYSQKGDYEKAFLSLKKSKGIKSN